jgi:hypothetical protein
MYNEPQPIHTESSKPVITEPENPSHYPEQHPEPENLSYYPEQNPELDPEDSEPEQCPEQNPELNPVNSEPEQFPDQNSEQKQQNPKHEQRNPEHSEQPPQEQNDKGKLQPLHLQNDINLFYKSLDIAPKLIFLFDTGNQGINALNKTYNLDVIKQLITTVRNKIDKSRKLIHENWLKSRIRKKLPPYGKKPFLKLFHYLNHFNLYYYFFHVSNKIKIPDRPLDQKLKGIYEDVKTYSKFLR